jgi:pseudouridine-5'-phosphate glycosidase
MKITFNEEVAGARHFDTPIVALESTVIAHGLPYPQNIETAYKLERIVREAGAVPATIAVFDGSPTVGLSEQQYELLATSKDIRKLSVRDLPIAVAGKLNGATTVSTTALIAHQAGIRTFATGGIGGIHRGGTGDISADLPVLARTPIVVVCSGAKLILDLPATREWLETWGVTVLGWKTDIFPAFYSRSSGLTIDQRVETAQDVSRIVDGRDEVDLSSAVLVTVPVPAEAEMAADEIERLLAEALRSASEHGIKGKDVTPFLLAELTSRSEGRTLKANIALLENNARVAAEIAKAIG